MILSENQRYGRTLVEMVVVFALLTILAALLLPAVQRAREAAASTRCRNNLKQLALAVQMYEDTHGQLPISNSEKALGWGVQVLPYLEQDALYATFDLGAPFDEPANIAAAAQRPTYFVCPWGSADGSAALGIPPTHYYANAALANRRLADIDSRHATALLGESAGLLLLPWTGPATLPMFSPKFSPHSRGGGNVAFADLHVGYIDNFSLVLTDSQYGF